MNTNSYEFYEKIITTNMISVITQCKGFLDCSVGGYNFSCCYNYKKKRWDVMIDKGDDFILCNKLLSKNIFNLLKIRVGNGEVR